MESRTALGTRQSAMTVFGGGRKMSAGRKSSVQSKVSDKGLDRVNSRPSAIARGEGLPPSKDGDTQSIVNGNRGRHATAKVRVKLPPIEAYHKDIEFPAEGPGRVVVRLERLMGTDRIRPTDARYMSTLLERLEEDEAKEWTKRRLIRIKAERKRYRKLVIDGLMEPGPGMEDLKSHPIFRVNRILQRLQKMDSNIAVKPMEQLPPITLIDPFEEDRNGRAFKYYPGHEKHNPPIYEEYLKGAMVSRYRSITSDIPPTSKSDTLLVPQDNVANPNNVNPTKTTKPQKTKSETKRGDDNPPPKLIPPEDIEQEAEMEQQRKDKEKSKMKLADEMGVEDEDEDEEDNNEDENEEEGAARKVSGVGSGSNKGSSYPLSKPTHVTNIPSKLVEKMEVPDLEEKQKRYGIPMDFDLQQFELYKSDLVKPLYADEPKGEEGKEEGNEGDEEEGGGVKRTSTSSKPPTTGKADEMYGMAQQIIQDYSEMLTQSTSKSNVNQKSSSEDSGQPEPQPQSEEEEEEDE